MHTRTHHKQKQTVSAATSAGPKIGKVKFAPRKSLNVAVPEPHNKQRRKSRSKSRRASKSKNVKMSGFTVTDAMY